MKNFRFFRFFITVTFLFICMMPSFLKGEVQPATPTYGSADEVMVNNSYVVKLALDLQPTIFINETDRFLYGSGNFLVVECALSQIQQLYDEDAIFSSVQLIRIKIEEGDDPFSLDLDLLQSFPQLQYVWLIYLYDACNDETDACLLEKTQNSITSGNEEITIIYSLSISQK